MITAFLSGEVDGVNTGIEGGWITFESLLPDIDSDEGEEGSSTFGEMSPPLVETDENGIAKTIFSLF